MIDRCANYIGLSTVPYTATAILYVSWLVLWCESVRFFYQHFTLGSSYKKAREMNIKYRDRKMAKAGLHDAARELQSLLRPKAKLSGVARKPKNKAEPFNVGPSCRSLRLSTRM